MSGASAYAGGQGAGRYAVRAVLGVALAFGAGYAVWTIWRDPSLAEIPSDIRLWPLVLAFLVQLVGVTVHPPLWLALYRGLGGRLTLREAYRVYVLSNIGKYVPGKVVLVAGRVAMLRERGEPASMVVTSTVLEVLLSLLAAAVAAMICVPALLWEWGLADRETPVAWVLVLALPAALVGLHPRVLGLALRLLARLVPRRVGGMQTTAPPYRTVLLVLLANLLSRVSGGLSLLLVTWSVNPLDMGWLPFLMGAQAISYLVAFSVPIAPAGLGVREGVMGLLLSTAMPVPAAAIVTVLSRALSVAAELVAAGIAVAVRSDARRVSA